MDAALQSLKEVRKRLEDAEGESPEGQLSKLELLILATSSFLSRFLVCVGLVLGCT